MAQVPTVLLKPMAAIPISHLPIRLADGVVAEEIHLVVAQVIRSAVEQVEIPSVAEPAIRSVVEQVEIPSAAEPAIRSVAVEQVPIRLAAADVVEVLVLLVDKVDSGVAVNVV